MRTECMHCVSLWDLKSEAKLFISQNGKWKIKNDLENHYISIFLNMTNYSLFFGVFDILNQVKLNLKEIFTDAK